MGDPILGMPEAWGRVASEYRRHIAPGFQPAAHTLCRAVGVGPGKDVLDIACGPGTAAFAARARGARHVVGIDYARDMIVVARADAGPAPPVHFAVGHALHLPTASTRFDIVVSSFGLIFAPDPLLAAAEAARVLRRGGRLGLLVWPPGGSVGAYQEAAFRYVAAAPSGHDPFQWGVPDTARRWLGGSFGGVAITPLDVPFTAVSRGDAWRVLRTATGRVAAAYAGLDERTRRRLDGEMEHFFGQFERPDGSVSWHREALLIEGTRA